MPNYFWTFFLFCFFSIGAQAQHGNHHIIHQPFSTEWKRIDTLSIYPSSFVVLHGKDTLKASAYEIDFLSATFRLIDKSTDSLTLSYQVWPFDFTKQYLKRDTSLIFSGRAPNERDLFKIEANSAEPTLFGGNEIAKNGSISRGLSFGNKQSLGINSALNLELNGMISDNLKLSASISDANIPIQADGNKFN